MGGEISDFLPKKEVEQQVWGEQKLRLDEFPSRAGEGGWSRAQLGSSSWESTQCRDQSCTFDLESLRKQRERP